jgi:steroid Delta-isomerase
VDAVERHQARFNDGVRTGDFGPWLDTFAEDTVVTFTGLPIGPLHGRRALAETYAEHPPSSTMRVQESSVEGDRVTGRFIWADAPATGGVFVLVLREDKVISMDVTLNAPPPPPAQPRVVR